MKNLRQYKTLVGLFICILLSLIFLKFYYNKIIQQEKDNLSITISSIIYDSVMIKKINFLGKDQSQVLLDKFVESIPNVSYIYLQDRAGKVVIASKSFDGMIKDIEHTQVIDTTSHVGVINVEDKFISEVIIPFRSNGLNTHNIQRIRVGIESSHKSDSLRAFVFIMAIILCFLVYVIFQELKKSNGLSSDLQKSNDKLDNMNKNLAKKVEEEIAKRQKQQSLLIQQSKMAAMGEMLESIAHQWRQPLNILGLNLFDAEQAFYLQKLDQAKFEKFIEISNHNIQYMSKTIDDFRNFFAPHKEKKAFFPSNCYKEIKEMFGVQFDKCDILLSLIEFEELKIIGFENEFKQALLNMMNNAKDSILERAKSEPFYKGEVVVEIFKEAHKGIIKVRDNGTGVKDEVIERVFEPYFTTKFQTQGTGIGLYMSKQIIEKNMGGKLSVQNHNNGAEFIMEFAL